MISKNKVPILVIAYRRHDILRRLLDCLPNDRHIYICVDGPCIPAHEQDVDLVRNLVDEFLRQNHFCAVLIREENFGGPIGIPMAIDWAFEHEDEICILEEDCIPTHLAFTYIDRIFPFLHGSEIVAGATLNNFIAARFGRKFDSPFLSIYGHIWGWAITKNAWFMLRPSPEIISSLRFQISRKALKEMLYRKLPGDFFAQLYWRRIFESILDGSRYHWDYAFLLRLWCSDLYFVAPPCNLVSNIGFDERSENCKIKSLNHELPVATSDNLSDCLALKRLPDLNYFYQDFDKFNQLTVFNSGFFHEIKRNVRLLIS